MWQDSHTPNKQNLHGTCLTTVLNPWVHITPISCDDLVCRSGGKSRHCVIWQPHSSLSPGHWATQPTLQVIPVHIMSRVWQERESYSPCFNEGWLALPSSSGGLNRVIHLVWRSEQSYSPCLAGVEPRVTPVLTCTRHLARLHQINPS